MSNSTDLLARQREALALIAVAIVTARGLPEAVNSLWTHGHPDHFLHCARCGSRAVSDDGEEPYCRTCDLDGEGGLRPDSPLALIDCVQELQVKAR